MSDSNPPELNYPSSLQSIHRASTTICATQSVFHRTENARNWKLLKPIHSLMCRRNLTVQIASSHKGYMFPKRAINLLYRCRRSTVMSICVQFIRYWCNIPRIHDRKAPASSERPLDFYLNTLKTLQSTPRRHTMPFRKFRASTGANCSFASPVPSQTYLICITPNLFLRNVWWLG